MITMQKSDARRISEILENTYGISLSEETGLLDGYQFVKFHVDLIPTPNCFSVFAHISWKSIEISFIPDDYAGELVESMGRSAEANKAFSIIATKIVQSKGKLEFSINCHQADPFNPSTWDPKWNQVNLKLTIFTGETDLADIRNLEPILIHWIGRFFTLLLSLLPIEEDSEPDIRGMPEGALTYITVNKYERNPINREVCIAENGCFCHICGLKFEEEYGKIGVGFIHVHHITPVSKLGNDYIIDPTRDLVPVCPNCHAMLHKYDPPLSIDELKRILKK